MHHLHGPVNPVIFLLSLEPILIRQVCSFSLLNAKYPAEAEDPAPAMTRRVFGYNIQNSGGFFWEGEGLYMQGKPSMGDGRCYKVKWECSPKTMGGDEVCLPESTWSFSFLFTNGGTRTAFGDSVCELSPPAELILLGRLCLEPAGPGTVEEW